MARNATNRLSLLEMLFITKPARQSPGSSLLKFRVYGPSRASGRCVQTNPYFFVALHTEIVHDHER